MYAYTCCRGSFWLWSSLWWCCSSRPSGAGCSPCSSRRSSAGFPSPYHFFLLKANPKLFHLFPFSFLVKTFRMGLFRTYIIFIFVIMFCFCLSFWFHNFVIWLNRIVSISWCFIIFTFQEFLVSYFSFRIIFPHFWLKIKIFGFFLLSLQIWSSGINHFDLSSLLTVYRLRCSKNGFFQTRFWIFLRCALKSPGFWIKFYAFSF